MLVDKNQYFECRNCSFSYSQALPPDRLDPYREELIKNIESF